jgi:hypothetical protein
MNNIIKRSNHAIRKGFKQTTSLKDFLPFLKSYFTPPIEDPSTSFWSSLNNNHPEYWTKTMKIAPAKVLLRDPPPISHLDARSSQPV